MNRRAQFVRALQQRLGHEFADPDLLEQALTHPGASHGSGKVANNQVLEFLGDRVLGLLVAEALVEAGPHWREGELSRRQVALVSGASCAAVARGLGVGPALRLDGSHSKQGGRDNERILGDAMEAVMAAVYLDGGLPAARALFYLAWKDALAAALGELNIDPKTMLNEWAMARGLTAPSYQMIQRAGPQHAPTFTAEVTVESHRSATGVGATVRAAEQAAAKAFLGRQDPH